MKKNSVLLERNCIRNHNGGRGEIGLMLNHTVYQSGTIGINLLNHYLNDGAPSSKDVIQFECDETSLAKELGLYSYPIRSFVLSNPGDIFQVGDELKSGLEWLIDHYQRIGIPCAESFIYNYDFFAESYLDYKLSVFFFGKEANLARPDQKRFSATKFFNNKNNVVKLARDLGIRTPRTETYSSAAEVDLRYYSQGRYPLVVKIGNSVSGLGFEKCNNLSDLINVLGKIEKISQKVDFQIQEYLPGATFLSAQWWIDDLGCAQFLTGTCNFIEGEANHAGNWGSENIPHNDLKVFTEKIANLGAQLGLRDWVGFDIAFCQGQFYLIECNPRYTGAAYPFVAVRKIFGNSAGKIFWAHRNYSTEFKSVEGFSLNGLEYDAKKNSGWIVINNGPLTVGDGKIGALFVGDEASYQKEEEKLKNILA